MTMNMRERKKYLVLTGCTLLMMPISVHLIFGNILTYLLSYYHSRPNSMAVWVNPLWTTTAFILAHPLGILLSELINNYIPPRKAMVFGVLFLAAPVLLSYYTIVEPLGFVLMFGAVQGIGGGFVTSLALKLVFQVMPEEVELGFTIAWIGPGFYALCHMLMALYLINPTNKSPGQTVFHMDYFTEASVIENVPAFFLKTGLLTLLIEVTGLLLIQFSTDLVSDLNSLTEVSVLSMTSLQEGGTTPLGRRHDRDRSQEFLKYGSESDNGEQSHHEDRKQQNGPSKAGADKIVTGNDSEAVTPAGSSNPNNHLSTRQVLSCGNFWKAWFMMLLMNHSFYVHTNLYKQYGLTDIHRDKLLTMCGVMGIALMMTTKPFLNVLANKIGLKLVMLILCALTTILMSLMPIFLSRSHLLYVILVILQFSFILSLAIFMNLLPLILFGGRHYSRNLGLLETAQILIYVLDSFITPLFIRYTAWSNLFVSATFSSTLGFFLCLSLPKRDLQIND